MPNSAGFPTISQYRFYDTSPVNGGNTYVEAKVGQLGMSQIGQMYRFVKAGASALVIGNVLQGPAEQTNFKDMVVQAAVATSVSPNANTGYPIPVTLGGTATTTTTDFAGGLLVISSGASMLGQSFTIISNDIQSTTNGTCNFYVLEAPQVALTTSATATAYKSLYGGVIQMPGPKTARIIGGAITAIAASSYGWIQVLGPGSVLSDATVTAAATIGLSASASTAGAATKAVNQDQQIGDSMSTVTVSAETEGCFWRTL